MAKADPLILRVVGAEDGDSQELEELTRTLQRALLDLNVEKVEPLQETDRPERAKGLGSLVGWLAVQFGSSPALPAAAAILKDWVTRNRRVVECSIGSEVLRVTGATSAQQNKIIEVWLAQHAA